MTSADRKTPGFHTFVMTGDAIIKTNFNPFKPTRQIPMDTPVAPVSADVTSSSPRRESFEHLNSPTPVAPPGDSEIDQKAFIPGFVRLDSDDEMHKKKDKRKRLLSGQPSTDCMTHDSGIDVNLSDITSEEHQQPDTSSTLPKSHETNDQNQRAETAAADLSTRLYNLDGFSPADVSHYIIKS